MENNFSDLTFGPPRLYRVVVPAMYPQQVPWLRYELVRDGESGETVCDCERWEGLESERTK